MSAASVRVLLIACEGATLPAVAAASPFGPFELAQAEGLEAGAQALAMQPVDAVVIGCRTVDARRLVEWPALSQAVADAAVLVLTADEPGADLTMLLARRGVQDVLPLAVDPIDALPRAIRLGLERKAQERLARKSYATDLMTGLPNQAQLIEHANQLLALREREPAPMAVLAMRLEGLASAEAQHGRETANVLRRKVAVRLRAAVRASDVVASIGPDAFAVLLSKFQDPSDAEHVAAKLLAAMHPPFAVAGAQVALPAAVGVAQYPTDGKDAAGLLRRALGLAAATPAQGRAGMGTGGAAPAANDPPA